MNEQIQNELKFFAYCANYEPLFPPCDEQEQWILQMAEYEELNIVGVYKDEKSKTTEFEKLLKNISKGKANGIIVWDMSMIPKTQMVEYLIQKNKIHVIKPFITSD